MQFVDLTYTLFDGDGFKWDIQSDGSVLDGTEDAFNGGLEFNDFLASGLAVLEDGGRTLDLGFDQSSNLALQREVYVSPIHGFARFFDSVTNLSTTTQTYTYELDTVFGHENPLYTTSDGDSTLDLNDGWIIARESGTVAGDPTPATGVLFTNPADPLGTTSFNNGSTARDVDFTITLAPGETVSFLSFGVQGATQNDVIGEFNRLSRLPEDALYGLSSAEMARVANWSIAPRDLTLQGTQQADLLNGASGNDEINALRGDDRVFGNDGDDVLRGGLGGDLVHGGAGDDALFGDGTVQPVTTTAERQLATGENLAISLTMPDAANGTSVLVSGFLSREQVVSENVDVVFAIDVSGSTDSSFSGARPVGDVNGDGTPEQVLDAEIASFEALLSSIVDDANLPDANITILPFASNASRLPTLRAGADSDRDGVADVVEQARALRSSGGTDFEAALQAAIGHFDGSDAGQKVLYFLSDGNNNEGGSLTDEVSTLQSMGVQIQSFGVGSAASEADLDIVDDGINNDSTTIVLDPSTLSDELLDPGIEAAEIAAVRLFVNGQIARSLDPEALTITPFGLRYFETQLTGLRANADDVVELRVIANDGSNTVVRTTQRLENLTGVDGDDVLIGGAGNDLLEGGAGNDMLTGGAGADLLRGGAGRDFVRYDDATHGVLVDLRGAPTQEGDAFGDSFSSIEGVFGSQFQDQIYGDAIGERLEGLAGNDLLVGLAGNDAMLGGAGADILVGGTGIDVLLGGVGNDRAFGGADDDRLSGSAGNDLLVGGLGRDVLTGGADRDIFLFASNDGDVQVARADRISDFSEAQNDLIHLAQIDGNTALAGIQDLRFIGTDVAFTGAGQVRWVSNGGLLDINTDADVQSEIRIVVRGTTSIEADDLIL